MLTKCDRFGSWIMPHFPDATYPEFNALVEKYDLVCTCEGGNGDRPEFSHIPSVIEYMLQDLLDENAIQEGYEILFIEALEVIEASINDV